LPELSPANVDQSNGDTDCLPDDDLKVSLAQEDSSAPLQQPHPTKAKAPSRVAQTTDAIESKQGLFAFGFGRISREEANAQSLHGFEQIRAHGAQVLKEQMREEASQVEVKREHARLRKQKSRAKKRGIEIANGVRSADGSQKRVSNSLNCVPLPVC